MTTKRKTTKKHLTLKVIHRKARKVQASKHQEHRIKGGNRKRQLEDWAGDT
jgi:hypothetical protein